MMIAAYSGLKPPPCVDEPDGEGEEATSAWAADSSALPFAETEVDVVNEHVVAFVGV